MKQEKGTELYIDRCNLNARIGLAWFRPGIQILRGKRKGREKDTWPLCQEEENMIHIFLKCKETQIWTDKFLNAKLLCIKEEIAYKKIISCNKKQFETFR